MRLPEHGQFDIFGLCASDSLSLAIMLARKRKKSAHIIFLGLKLRTGFNFIIMQFWVGGGGGGVMGWGGRGGADGGVGGGRMTGFCRVAIPWSFHKPAHWWNIFGVRRFLSFISYL